MSHPELSIGNGSNVLEEVAARFKTQKLEIKNSTHNVGIADERLVIKAPKSTKNMASLAIEAAALEILEQNGPLAAATPRLVEFSANPVFLVTTYLPGRIIEASSIHELSLKEREALGHDIGAFVVSLVEQVDVEMVRQQLPPFGEEDTWESIFTASAGTFSSSMFPSTSLLARQLYAAWTHQQKDTTNDQFIQGDLRLGNMAVSENNRLHGVFDFGRACIGNASSEISPLVNLDSTIMQGAIDELQTASIGIDMDHVSTWDEIKKITMLINYINGGSYRDTPPLYVKRACRILSAHYPNLSWEEFNQLRV